MNTIGIDILEIDRIENAINKNSSFLSKIFTEYEREYILKKDKSKYQSGAGIFSAKESVSKVLGTGIRGFSLRDIEIFHSNEGKPKIRLHNGAKDLADKKNIYDIDISITHNKSSVVTVAVATIDEKKGCRHLISIPKRELETNKDDYGRIGIIGGSVGMSGSVYLSSLAALKTGSGVVYTIIPESIRNIMEIKSIENIIIPVRNNKKGYLLKESFHDMKEKTKTFDAIGIGMGMGRDLETTPLLEQLILNTNVPLVIDADGIIHLYKLKNLLKNINKKIIITPHLKEFSYFTDIDVSELKKRKKDIAIEIAKKYNLIVALKGNETIITDGRESYINKTGNPGMATAGSGDVLTGIITSFIGQGFGAFHSTKMGVYIHGLAGDISKEEKSEYGIIASDIVNNIPYTIKKLIEEK